jgi:hypothetical protein
MCGVLLKIGFEKAFDKVNWAFLYQMMQIKGFGEKMCDLLMKLVRGHRVVIKVKDQVGPHFTTYICWCQAV